MVQANWFGQSPVTIEAGGSTVAFAAPVTEGYFYPDPNGPSANPDDPDSDNFWAMREYYLFERIAKPGQLTLSRGVNVVRLRVEGETGKEISRLRSLELTPVAQRAAVEADRTRARSRRADTDWFADASCEMWLCFLDHVRRHSPDSLFQRRTACRVAGVQGVPGQACHSAAVHNMRT